MKPLWRIVGIFCLLVAQPALALDLQGHRGARGLAPENTLPAFAAALSLGVTTLELDTGITKDGVVVISHNTALNPDITRDSAGQWLGGPGPAIHALTFSELQQYDVSDPFHPKQTGSVRIGGMVRRAPHPSKPRAAVNGAPQMVEVSRDGRRIYLTNSLYSPWDAQFYPDGIRGWMVKLDAHPEGGIAFDEKFFLEFPEGIRGHQVRLQGGDASSDSFCYS